MKVITGQVVSAKQPYSVTVRVERLVAHPKYHKRLRRHTKYHAQDDLGAKEGDTVQLVQISPVSKSKTFKLLKILK